MEEWSVSRSTDIDIDFSVFELWLQGRQNKDISDVLFASNKLRNRYSDDVIQSHIQDQFSLYQFLKNYLEHPWNFIILRHQLNPQSRNLLVNIYYHFNHAFARELLNHRISSKLRKDVDEIGYKLRLPVLACLRYFDNVRIVLNKVEDNDKYSLIEYIKHSFHMNEELAKGYATIAFLQLFKLEVNRKRMQFLSFADLCFLSVAIMDSWGFTGSLDDSSGSNLDFVDRDFFNRLHECKSMDSDGIQAISDMVVSRANGHHDGSISEFKETTKLMLKEIFTAASHLKDIKEILYNFCKITEIGFSMTSRSFHALFTTLADLHWNSISDHLSSKEAGRITNRDWERFVKCTHRCCARIHEAAHQNR